MQGRQNLWQQLYDDLAHGIRSGELAAGSKLPSIQELCTRHGVSHMTVRSALNRLIADGLVTSRPGAGYYSIGPGSADPRTHAQVALLLPGRNPFFIDIIHGAAERLQQRGFSMVVANAAHDGAVLAQRMLELRDTVDGFIISPGRGGHDYRAWIPLLERRTPFVFIDHWIPGLAAPLVASDNEAGGRIGIAHLLGLGHRRIWTLAESGFSSMDERLAGRRAALAEAGVADDPALVLTSDRLGNAAGEELAATLAPLLEPGDAVFALNEPLAQGAYRALRSRGWRAGVEVAVLGFDDTVAVHFEPPLSTLAQDLVGMGAAAADALLARIATPAAPPPQPVRLAPTLIVRASSQRSQEVA